MYVNFIQNFILVNKKIVGQTPMRVSTTSTRPKKTLLEYKTGEIPK